MTVPANDRVAVRFPAMTENVGTAYAQIVASGPYGGLAQVAIPVYTPATTEATRGVGRWTRGRWPSRWRSRRVSSRSLAGWR